MMIENCYHSQRRMIENKEEKRVISIRRFKKESGSSNLDKEWLANKEAHYLTRIKKKCKQYSETLCRREKDDGYPDNDSYEEEPVILEKIVKAALKVLGRKKSPSVDGIPTELLQARGWICHHPNKNTPTKMENNDLQTGNVRTTARISHASHVMLKVMQPRLLPRTEQEVPDVQAGFRKETHSDLTASFLWILERSKEFEKVRLFYRLQ